MKITAESIRKEIDIERVKAQLRELESFGDYERRLIAAGLAILNKDAKQLPTCAIKVFLEEKCRSTS